jgi:hypothetical protein
MKDKMLIRIGSFSNIVIIFNAGNAGWRVDCGNLLGLYKRGGAGNIDMYIHPLPAANFVGAKATRNSQMVVK